MKKLKKHWSIPALLLVTCGIVIGCGGNGAGGGGGNGVGGNGGGNIPGSRFISGKNSTTSFYANIAGSRSVRSLGELGTDELTGVVQLGSSVIALSGIVDNDTKTFALSGGYGNERFEVTGTMDGSGNLLIGEIDHKFMNSGEWNADLAPFTPDNSVSISGTGSSSTGFASDFQGRWKSMKNDEFASGTLNSDDPFYNVLMTPFGISSEFIEPGMSEDMVKGQGASRFDMFYTNGVVGSTKFKELVAEILGYPSLSAMKTKYVDMYVERERLAANGDGFNILEFESTSTGYEILGFNRKYLDSNEIFMSAEDKGAVFAAEGEAREMETGSTYGSNPNHNIPASEWPTATVGGKTFRYNPRDYVSSPTNGVTGSHEHGWYYGTTFMGYSHAPTLEEFVQLQSFLTPPEPLGIYYTKIVLIKGVHEGKEYIHMYSRRAYDEEARNVYTDAELSTINTMLTSMGQPPISNITYTAYTDSNLATAKAKSMNDIPSAAKSGSFNPDFYYEEDFMNNVGDMYELLGRY